ncbi:MAG: MarR family winged helix-turn-helix transcriptional regulator [Bryobacteraceae bacterium]
MRAYYPSLPLSTLLSQLLVAFTIEFDNEFEHRNPHRTTAHGSAAGSGYGPWLASMVMWANCVQFVPEEGISVAELERLARTKTNWNGMQRWGYIVVQPEPADNRTKSSRSNWIVRATPKGRKAQEVWRPLFGEIENRWRTRFGEDAIHQLRESLGALVSRINLDLPDCLPILRYGLFSIEPGHEWRAPVAGGDAIASRLPLPALLSRVLLAFAIEFERESNVSLAIGANVVRVLDEKGVRIRDLPILTGVSKEAISMSLGVLQKRRLAVTERDQTGSRAKVARLTPKGQEAQESYRRLIGVIEERWHERFGDEAISTLRKLLERLVGEPTAEASPLFRGLEPYPDGWRASVRKPNTLPHYPMVLHRGGFPDGS